ncbi:TraR/DksA C4-type zinc finger protein [Candidatus Daviesbacteria bacterium]|nr:TraR/DksA C4-type zinc finger protein [Candidatus Daviesbacteria bacterium]
MDKVALENSLLQKKDQLESYLKEMDYEEIQFSGVMIDSEEIASAAIKFERNSRLFIVKRSFQETLDKINRSLQKVKNGTYGTCESCGKTIGIERLQAIPLTIFCINCS